MIGQLLLAVLAILLLVKSLRRPSNFPPGPRGLPLVGAIRAVTKADPVYPFRAMMNMSKIYGPVVGFYLGPRQAFVSVCGYEAAKEALLNEDLNTRPDLSAIRERTFNKRLGIMFVDGDFWREQRRFSMRHLRDLGFGRTSIEDVMLDEIGDLSGDIRTESDSNGGRVVNMKGKLNISVVNILWAIVAGQRFRHDDAKFQHLLRSIEQFFRSGNTFRALISLPLFLYKLFPFLRNVTGQRGDLIAQRVTTFIQDAMEYHEEYTEDFARDFLDVYLNEIKKQQPDSSFNREQLISTIVDLFAAGAESTSNSIGFVLLYLIHYPDVQKKMQLELDDVCGSGLPLLRHKIDLTYSEAVMMEVQRVSSIAPLTVPHCAARDTKLCGYTIPKGAIVQVNLHSIHNEKSFWGDPDVFRPERHIGHDGKLIRTDHFIPFGIGKRMCMGESLARITYFLFTAALVKQFSFAPVPGEPLPTLEPINGFTLGYDGFRAVITTRC